MIIIGWSVCYGDGVDLKQIKNQEMQNIVGSVVSLVEMFWLGSN